MAEFIEELEARLIGVIREHRERIREAYRQTAPDPQAVDGAIDAMIATVIRELEDAGYAFDTASVDNVLYHLSRKVAVEGEGWSVAPRE